MEVQMKPETLAKIELSTWLFRFGNEVFWEKKNEFFPVFNVTGVQKKPDLLVKTSGKRLCAIEVKPATSFGNVTSSMKIIDYYKNYVQNNTSYYIGAEQQTITDFLIATELSVNGHLFKNESVRGVANWIRRDMNVLNSRKKCLNEFEQTFAFVRTLWKMPVFRIVRHKDVSLGVLIANSSGAPARQVMTSNKNGQWVQNFRPVVV